VPPHTKGNKGGQTRFGDDIEEGKVSRQSKPREKKGNPRGPGGQTEWKRDIGGILNGGGPETKKTDKKPEICKSHSVDRPKIRLENGKKGGKNFREGK